MLADANKYLCTLDVIFLCPNRKESKACSDKEAKCGFIQKIESGKMEPEPKPYVRQKRWYEQYYDGTAKKDK